LAVADAPGRPYGIATADGRVFVTDIATGRLLQFSLGQ
jgi:low affinity Fe/Cu permease